jgi:hypothetical protein
VKQVCDWNAAVVVAEATIDSRGEVIGLVPANLFPQIISEGFPVRGRFEAIPIRD